MNGKEIVFKIVAECCRLLIGIVFIFSGFVKAVDPMGGAIKIGEYLVSFGLESIEPFVSLFSSINLSAIEFALGCCMLLGVYLRYTSFLTLAFMMFMTPLTLYLAIYEPVSDCGCFGDALVITNWETFYKNVILFVASIVTFVYNQRLFRCYTVHTSWFVPFYTYVFGFCFAYYNYNHLPPIDFRPYKTGANIPALMEMPEDAPEDEYIYTFVYEKEGVKKAFSLDDYPANDSSWVFVSSETKLLKRGYLPPVAAFDVFDKEGRHIADQIIRYPDLVLLMVAPKLENAYSDCMDQINELYDYALENKVPFYFVTGSDSVAIEEWINDTGAEYPFFMADEVLLQTIVRSNPGLILLKNGTILAKWHYNDFPEENGIRKLLEESMIEKATKSKEEYRLIANLLTFLVPLLLVWIYDYFRFRRKKEKKKETT